MVRDKFEIARNIANKSVRPRTNNSRPAPDENELNFQRKIKADEYVQFLTEIESGNSNIYDEYKNRWDYREVYELYFIGERTTYSKHQNIETSNKKTSKKYLKLLIFCSIIILAVIMIFILAK